jgi:DMSO/TMAO reductase YedYZ molybdopterin-dependent catalytic subunit
MRAPVRAVALPLLDGSEMAVTRGFVSRRQHDRNPGLPPGQYDAGLDWPVLHAESTPAISTSHWSFEVDGLVDKPVRWSWEQIHTLPRSRYDGAIHCVTAWSKFDMSFEGVSVDTLLEAAGVKDGAMFVLVRSHTGYTTNIPLDDLTDGKAWVVWNVDGAPLTAVHGGPARLLVPHLYFWKSAKWVSGLTLLEEDQPGFWEQNGYHNHGDPWLEQRYRGD